MKKSSFLKLSIAAIVSFFARGTSRSDCCDLRRRRTSVAVALIYNFCLFSSLKIFSFWIIRFLVSSSGKFVLYASLSVPFRRCHFGKVSDT